MKNENLKVLKIEHLEIKTLKPWEKNARTHSKKQIRQIADSIKTFGFNNPVLLGSDRGIIAGHGRVEAAKLLKLKSVPCVELGHMSEAQKRAYILADNKLALNAGWDEELLGLELGELTDLSDELDFDLDITGFSLAEVDGLVEGLSVEQEGNPDEDQLPEDDIEPRCKEGDVWQLGNHRLICGNALDRQVAAALMENDKATMVFTDPPYNVPIDGHVGGAGKTKHREFAFASGEMSESEFVSFLQTSLTNMADHSVDGSIHFVCMDWRHIAELRQAASEVYSELKNLIVWVKDNGGMGSFYRSRHELIFAFKKGDKEHKNTFELGQHGRYRTNVWEYRGVNTLKTGRMDELGMHPTVKPVQMIGDAIKDVSGRRDIVLDLFGGSGSTLIAAEKTGRYARLCEIDEHYCDVILRRYEAYAHDEAVLIGNITDEVNS
ncbi:MAG: DNA methyltransferase [Pseudomonadota bacterium]